MNQQARCVLSALFAAVSVSAAGPARADVTLSGDVSPASPTDPWYLGASPLLVGGTVEGPPRTGSVLVYNRGTVISAGAVLGGPYEEGSGTVEVTGYRSTWINNGSLELGGHESSTGALIVRRGAQVITDDLVVSGPYPNAYGSVLVEGYDASLTSRTIAYIGHMWGGKVDIRQGASFFSHDVLFGYTGSKTPYGPIQASITGSGSRWVNTGVFAVGTSRAARVSVYRGELSTVNAGVFGNPVENSVVTVSGWGGTWTNEGLLEVGSGAGFGGVVLGAHGKLVTGETVIRSQTGAGYLYLDDVYASWINHGDVTVLSSASTVWADPVLHIDYGGSVTIGGLLRVAQLPGGPGRPSWGVYIKDGNLTAGAIELEEDAGFYFLEGRLETGSFVGDLDNNLYGTLVVGEAYPSISITGSYAQRWLASTSFTVAGPSAAPLLYADGDVVLDGGALEVRAADGALPFQAGDTVTLLGWGGALVGAFESVDIDLPLAPGLAWDTSALYLTGQIVAVPE
ncbi:hypothetical protein WME89_00695 [Sorangium sp. So ce321]|uniref:hypothetical protein n=1 Tax=Sorangium sp. So ce321 TaxID=3133300 RepID=UPI003F61755E